MHEELRSYAATLTIHSGRLATCKQYSSIPVICLPLIIRSCQFGSDVYITEQENILCNILQITEDQAVQL